MGDWLACRIFIFTPALPYKEECKVRIQREVIQLTIRKIDFRVRSEIRDLVKTKRGIEVCKGYGDRVLLEKLGKALVEEEGMKHLLPSVHRKTDLNSTARYDKKERADCTTFGQKSHRSKYRVGIDDRGNNMIYLHFLVGNHVVVAKAAEK